MNRAGGERVFKGLKRIADAENCRGERCRTMAAPAGAARRGQLKSGASIGLLVLSCSKRSATVSIGMHDVSSR